MSLHVDENLVFKPRKKMTKFKSMYQVHSEDEPDVEGKIITHDDFVTVNKDPSEYLLIARVVLKKQRPLTEAELS